jgi:hypothetical protein
MTPSSLHAKSAKFAKKVLALKTGEIPRQAANELMFVVIVFATSARPRW